MLDRSDEIETESIPKLLFKRREVCAISLTSLAMRADFPDASVLEMIEESAPNPIVLFNSRIRVTGTIGSGS